MIKQYLKKLIKEVLEKDGIESLKIGQHTAYVRNDKVHVSAATPKLQLQGTEVSAMNLSLRENAGVIELYDETAPAIRASWSGTTGRRITPLIADTEIAANAVITAKILDANITTAKIADANVTTIKIADLGVATGKIAQGAVINAKLKNGALVALADAAATLTAPQIIDNGIFTITPTVARTLTTDTGTAIVGAIPGAVVGTKFEIIIVNTAAFDVTLAAGVDVTLGAGQGKHIINNVSGTWMGLVTTPTTVTIYRM